MADSRRPCSEHRPVQTSAVVVPGCSGHSTANPPPSPPSPPASAPQCSPCEPLEDLCLGDPAQVDSAETFESRIRSGIHVLRTEATSLRLLAQLYETDPIARDGFSRSVEAITRQVDDRGKLVVTGVGKSGHIAQKLVATFKSLGIPAVFLHPTEALHGDLGIVGRHDTLMFITYSGTTQELLSLLPHLCRSIPLILLTSHTRHATCDFLRYRPDAILLPAPVHELERISFGVPAPTTSTTMAVAVGDALALTAAKELHDRSVASVFSSNHPGGAIGSFLRKPQAIKDIAVPWDEVLVGDGICGDSLAVELLRAGYESKSGWVRVGGGVASPSRIRGLQTSELSRRVGDARGLVTARDEMISISADTDLRRAVDLIRTMMSAADDGEYVCAEDSIIAVVDKGDTVGVLEVGEVLSRQEVLDG